MTADNFHTNKIISLMINYNGGDVRRINHALKVFAFAQIIGHGENCDERTQIVIEYASILHDIGLHKAEETYDTDIVRYHEILGPGVAKELIDNLEIAFDIGK
jgi:HD superfamily phosphodiesterase